jgi:hypothetical protein
MFPEDPFQDFFKSMQQYTQPQMPTPDVAWHNVPDGNGVEPIPNGQSMPINADRWAGVFGLNIWREPALGSQELTRFVQYQQKWNTPDLTYEEYQQRLIANEVVEPGIAPWELYAPETRAVMGTRRVAQIILNRWAGNRFRDAIAAQFKLIGMEVKTEVTFRTALGIRFADVVVSFNGVRLFTVETKLGSSVYYFLQQAKDGMIWFQDGLPTFLKRSGSPPEINPAAGIHRMISGP